jgi:hypothetical protein
MKSQSRVRFLLPFILFASLLPGQEAARKTDPLLSETNLLAGMHSISTLPLYEYVRELSSEKFDGRLTGTGGYNRAAQWALDLFKRWNLKPAGEKGSYLQNFPNPYTLVLPGSELSLLVKMENGDTIRKSYTFEEDYYPGSTSDSNSVTAEVVYVGYGITAPELSYDEYQGVDVQGKIVLVEPEVPVSPDREAEEFKRWRPYSFHDYKVKNARSHGAAGMVYNYHIVNPNCIFQKDLSLTYVGPTVVNDLFTAAGRKHDAHLESIRDNKRPSSFAVGRSMTMKNATEHHPEGTGSNVIAMLEGLDPALKSEAILIGGHLDGLGRNPVLMPGANDNAAAVAVALGIAEALAKSRLPLKRSVIFILFGAEEQGVKGSEYYLAHPSIPNDRVRGFINLESVGRGDHINGGGGGNFPLLWGFFERNNRKYIHRPINAGFNANLARPRQDAAHFMWANIPTISFGTSGGDRPPFAIYHTTHDTIDIITPDIMADLARLIFLSVVEMANQ